MVIKEGKAELLTLFTGLDEYSAAGVNVKLHDTGLIEINGCDDDPNLCMTCHVLNSQLIWNFTPVVIPSPDKESSVTPFRRKK